MIEAFSHPDVRFFIGIDAESKLDLSVFEGMDVNILPEEERVPVKWGTYSILEASLRLMEFAWKHVQDGYFLMISGQDYPVKSSEELLAFLEENKGKEFVDFFSYSGAGTHHPTIYDPRLSLYYPDWLIERKVPHLILKKIWMTVGGAVIRAFPKAGRPYPADLKFAFGSCWWCITDKFMGWMMDQLSRRDDIIPVFEHSLSPEEAFVQTMLLSSPFTENKMPYLHYIDWSEGNSSPKLMEIGDYPAIYHSGKFVIRKVDSDDSKDLLDLLDQKAGRKGLVRSYA